VRRAAALFAFALAASISPARARADEESVAPLAPAAGPEAAAAPQPEEFGWQIVAADLAAIMVTFAGAELVDSAAVLLPYLLAAPIVHAAHGDIGGALGSLVLHVGLPIAGWYIGQALDGPECRSTADMWCIGEVALGPPLGGLVGVSLATALDATFLGHAERHAPAVAPAVTIDPNRIFVLSLAGRF
jgi:hypothetical protein